MAFPTWEPGHPVEPGDIGEIEGGVFIGQTTLAELFPDLGVQIESDNSPDESKFASKGEVTVHAGASGGPYTAGAVVANATIELKFGRAGSVVFHSSGVRSRFIKNLHTVRRYIAEHRQDWPSGYVLVSHVDIAESYRTLISQSKNATVTLKGDISAIKQFKIADASAGLTSMTSGTYERTGKGPVLMRLYGFGFSGRNPKLLGVQRTDATAPEPDFEEVSALHPAFDG